jgi:lipopolysaccharide heptosyltransferase II
LNSTANWPRPRRGGIKISVLKQLDVVLGRLLAFMLTAGCRTVHAKECSRLLFIRPGGVGDAVLLVPAIRALRRRFPDLTIHVLAERRNAGALSLCPAIDRVFCYDLPPELFAVLRAHYDAVIDTEQWHRLSAVVARLTRAPLTIGYATNERQRLFSHPVPYSHEEYEAESFFRLLLPMGITSGGEVELPFLTTPADARTRAENLLGGIVDKPFLVVFPGASIPERHWGADRFANMVRRLDSADVPVVVVGGREDVAAGEAIIAGGRGLNLAGKTSLAETAAIIERCALLVSGDSGILHMGVGLDIPTVSLFGPGIAAKWAPRGERHVVLNKRLACSPCTRFGYTPRCQCDVDCLARITPEEVADAVLTLLARTGQNNFS